MTHASGEQWRQVSYQQVCYILQKYTQGQPQGQKMQVEELETLCHQSLTRPTTTAATVVLACAASTL